jgi:hypothetical protein
MVSRPCHRSTNGDVGDGWPALVQPMGGKPCGSVTVVQNATSGLAIFKDKSSV